MVRGMRILLSSLMASAIFAGTVTTALASETSLPEGVVAVKDEKTGETRYRLSFENPDDPRTYSYEQMILEEEGYDEPEGRESYDEQDNYRDVVSIDNLDKFTDFYWDGYCTQNLKVYLANYLYYFTGDGDAYYEGSIIEGSFKDTGDYGGTVRFDVQLEDTLIHCEYHKKFKLFGFDSSYGDMTLKTQFVISDKGYAISEKTLKKYAEGRLGMIRPKSPNGRRTTVDKVWVGSATWKGDTYAPEKWFCLEDGADVSLTNHKDYTESQIKDMLIYLEKKSKGKIDFSICQPEVVEFYKNSHADIAGMLAILVAEGGCKAGERTEHWNFFNSNTPQGGTSIKNSGYWDAKADCKSMGSAMVTGFQWIYANYWKKGQDSFYKMSFNDYGHPQDSSEAEKVPAIDHCYNPWFADKGYTASGFEDYYAFCNKCARYRRELIGAAQ